jgi:hypothetical protein
VSIHPFERAGLGRAPFRLVGVHSDVGPHKHTDPATGLTVEVGSPGQPMGCCKYCFQGIANVYTVLSADGKRFTVGSDCAERIAPEVVQAKDAAAMLKAYRKARRMQATQRCIDKATALLAADPGLLADRPHPSRFFAAKYLTARDWATYGLAANTITARHRAARAVVKAAAEREVTA